MEVRLALFAFGLLRERLPRRPAFWLAGEPVSRLEIADGHLYPQPFGGLHQHEAGVDPQQLAQPDEDVVEKLMQVAAGEQPPVERLDPGDLLAILAEDEPVEIRLGRAENELSQNDHADDDENQRRVSRQAQDQLDARDHQHHDDDHRAEHGAAQEVVE